MIVDLVFMCWSYVDYVYLLYFDCVGTMLILY